MPKVVHERLGTGCALYSLGEAMRPQAERLELDEDVMKNDFEHEEDALAKGPWRQGGGWECWPADASAQGGWPADASAQRQPPTSEDWVVRDNLTGEALDPS